jgi:predicted dehydrogenase
MSNNLSERKSVLLIGTGPMAVAYAAVLKSLPVDLVVIGRGSESAALFENQVGLIPITGGLQKYLTSNTIDQSTFVINATGPESLMPSLKLLLDAGARNILVEKPAALSIEELAENKHYFEQKTAQIFVAYNRRFYASVRRAKELIDEDHGLLSVNFEFTEWAHKIEAINKAPGVKENWFFANSTHVIDLAFFFAGMPKEFGCYSSKGELKWHPKTNFAGAGITEKDVLFSYLANWESAGRWSVELLTNRRRFFLKPLEGLSVQMRGSMVVENVLFDDSLDQTYKPGVYLQTLAFLEGDDTRLLSLKQHIENSINVYLPILTGIGPVKS